ncbi:MAG: hypothetical protein VCE75_07725 [Alphaproteobacteria bacterium]
MKEFGLTLRVYDGRSFANPTQTLSQVRKKKGSGKGLSVAKNMKVGNLEDKFEEEFGLKVQVAGSDDSYLRNDNLTLNAAQQEDKKKLGRKERKAARQDDASDDGDDDSSLDEESLNISDTGMAESEDLEKLAADADESVRRGAAETLTRLHWLWRSWRRTKMRTCAARQPETRTCPHRSWRGWQR